MDVYQAERFHPRGAESNQQGVCVCVCVCVCVDAKPGQLSRKRERRYVPEQYLLSTA
jgi:hypothetical protein